MEILTIVAHPRTDSLTCQLMKSFVEGATVAGHKVDVLNLYEAGFNPILEGVDEPDWEQTEPVGYSPLVMKEIQRLKKYEGLAFVFPIWWYSMPAIMKGYIDRVWNYNFAYGNSKLPHKQVLWLGLAGGSHESYVKRGYEAMITNYFNDGLSSFTGIDQYNTHLIYDTLSEAAMNPKTHASYVEKIKQEAYDLGLNY